MADFRGAIATDPPYSSQKIAREIKIKKSEKTKAIAASAFSEPLRSRNDLHVRQKHWQIHQFDCLDASKFRQTRRVLHPSRRQSPWFRSRFANP